MGVELADRMLPQPPEQPLPVWSQASEQVTSPVRCPYLGEPSFMPAWLLSVAGPDDAGGVTVPPLAGCSAAGWNGLSAPLSAATTDHQERSSGGGGPVMSWTIRA
jgi:hypothetical protein